MPINPVMSLTLAVKLVPLVGVTDPSGNCNRNDYVSRKNQEPENASLTLSLTGVGPYGHTPL
jgi:hypothetical protein